jgi:hypothetical protein
MLECECDRAVVINLQYIMTEKAIPAYLKVLLQHSFGKTEQET